MTFNPTLLTLLLSVFTALLGVGIIVPVLPVFASDLGASGLGLGLIIASFSVVRGVLQPVIGHHSDRLGRKRFLLAGLIIYSLVGLFIPLAQSVSHLIAIRGFHGVGSAMIVPVAMAYVSLLSPEGREGRYMSYLNIAVFSGIGCGPLIGGILFDLRGVGTVFHAMALLSFAAFLLVVKFMPATEDRAQGQQPRLLDSFSEMLRSKRTGGILLARFATMIMMVPTMAFLPLLATGWQESSGFIVGAVIASRTLVNALFQVPFGRLADKVNKLSLLLSSSLALAAVVFAIPSLTGFSQMAAGYCLLGLAEAAVWATLGAYASVEAKNSYGHGTMMGVFSLAMSAGVFSGSILAGWSMDSLGITNAYRVSGIVVALLVIVAAVMIKGAEKESAAAK